MVWCERMARKRRGLSLFSRDGENKTKEEEKAILQYRMLSSLFAVVCSRHFALRCLFRGSSLCSLSSHFLRPFLVILNAGV